ncbi:type II toxin-antitoxin system RelE family toxin [Corynebacterium lipophiloflavum]|uniref:Addiction module toxin, RelE/StbE family n=1 Tax=Corynebacterium lipophiloflavum (strain ATCC 700352 / DSM 44291 / CCUG 37336 / JCM 10383 / DMMZ 1944) TaxID=525263 RepID=C0XQS2_CORLD|nr:type II toxin-antitoxin system RelE/ParE family toxin [Corynebacterium lipophiloflavum]EEI17486.1 addiction module toxin, RelE/StbE family [Corynebacterium lipophiloflavum DSM 44291]
MSYTITYVPSAAKAIRKLDRSTARRLLDAIESLASDPCPPGSIQLKGGSGEFRIRVGDYRVVYDIHHEELVVLVLRVGHRREVYR